MLPSEIRTSGRMTRRSREKIIIIVVLFQRNIFGER